MWADYTVSCATFDYNDAAISMALDLVDYVNIGFSRLCENVDLYDDENEEITRDKLNPGIREFNNVDAGDYTLVSSDQSTDRYGKWCFF